MAFISGDVNKSIGQSGPEVYLAKLKPRVLKSQCIPTDSTLWRIDKAEAFWKTKRKLLAESSVLLIGTLAGLAGGFLALMLFRLAGSAD